MRSMRQQLREDRRTRPRKTKKARPRVRRHLCKSKDCRGRVSFKAFNYAFMAWVHWPHPERDFASYCHGCREKFQREINRGGPMGEVMVGARRGRQSEVNRAAHAGDDRMVGEDPSTFDPLATAGIHGGDDDDEAG